MKYHKVEMKIHLQDKRKAGRLVRLKYLALHYSNDNTTLIFYFLIPKSKFIDLLGVLGFWGYWGVWGFGSIYRVYGGMEAWQGYWGLCPVGCFDGT